MRKKKLIEQNLLLFEQLEKTNKELAELKKELNENAVVIRFLKEKLEANNIEKAPVVVATAPKAAEKDFNIPTLKPDMEYGAKIIGEIVVAAAEHSNKLTANGSDKNKELVNLILGKTEISKAEILAIIESDDAFEEKCADIDKVAAVAKEYFKSVEAQIM